MNRVFLAIMMLMSLSAGQAFAQLQGNDTNPGDSCAGFASGATRMNADAGQDGSHILLMCDGTVWQSANGAGGGSSIWLNDGPGAPSEIYYNGGNVGIGTVDPTSKLEIAADGGGVQKLRVTALESGGESLSLGNGTGASTILFSNTGALWIGGVADVNANPVSGDVDVIIDSAGSVGIGAIPTTKLTVGGIVTATAFVGDGAGLTNLPGGGSPDNLGNHIATQVLRSDTHNTDDLGTTAIRWKDGWFAGTVTAGTFAGSGASLTALNAANLGSGTVPAARMPALTGDVTMTAGTTATNIAAGVVGTTAIADGTVALIDLAANSVNASKIVDLSVTNSDIANATIVATTKLSATGTKSSATFLRGDNTWAAVSASVAVGTLCGVAEKAGCNISCASSTGYTNVASCAGSNPASACPAGYTLITVDKSLFTGGTCNTGDDTVRACTRHCRKT